MQSIDAEIEQKTAYFQGIYLPTQLPSQTPEKLKRSVA
jgi:hypothetical protein